MQNSLTFNRTYLALILTALILVVIYIFISINKTGNNCPRMECPVCIRPGNEEKNEGMNDNNTNTTSQKYSNQQEAQNLSVNSEEQGPSGPPRPPGPLVPPEPLEPPGPPVDKVRQYDYRKSFDPLEEPTRRVPRHELPPIFLKRNIDIPTRGYPDNFTQIGVLVKKGDPSKNEDNKILRLFGRQEYPGSHKYEYYATVNSGNDVIKIPVETRRKELFDGDNVRIKELKDTYEVHLHKFDEPKYYPDIIY